MIARNESSERVSDAAVHAASPLSATHAQAIRTDAFVPGEVVGERYVIERVLGVGGVGIVLAAKHKELDETVAIKFLRPEVQNKPEIVRRFAREARAAVRIKSEHAARVFDVGVMPGRGPYLVMEYLEGKDLADVLVETGALSIRRAVELTLQACEALAVAHSNEIIHRDVKPENLFLARRADGTEILKVLDFGISKVALTGSVFGGDISLVKTQDLMGSPLYMSPEQIRSTADADQRSDIWALGVVLYELVTGQVPFQGETITKICAQVLEQDALPLTTHLPDVPEGFQAIVDRCLQKNPKNRFQNVAELAVAMLPFASTSARVFAERTTTILRASGAIVAVTMRFDSSMPPPPQGTEGAGGARLPEPPATTSALTRTGRVLALGVVLAAAVLGGGALFFLRGARAPAVVASTAAVTPVSYLAVVESEPSGARVEWEGKLLGETPLNAQFPAGTQALRLSKDGHVAETLTVAFGGDGATTRRVHVTLKRAETLAATPVRSPTGTPKAAPAPAALGRGAPSRAAPSRGGAAAAVVPTATAPAVPPAAASGLGTPPATSAAPAKVRVLDDSNRVRIVDDVSSSVPLMK